MIQPTNMRLTVRLEGKILGQKSTERFDEAPFEDRNSIPFTDNSL